MRCLIKNYQFPKTLYTSKKTWDDMDKTIKNFKEEIIAKEWYPGDVGFPELRISRRKKKAELDDDISLAEKYGARTVRVFCIRPEWRGGFPDALENRSRSNSPEVEQPSQPKQAPEPGASKATPVPIPPQPEVQIPVVKGEDDESDFSDQSDDEKKVRQTEEIRYKSEVIPSGLQDMDFPCLL